MRISSRTHYAINAAIDLARHYQDKPVRSEDVALRQNISKSFLDQIFLKMRRSGIISSVRGPGGGYVLSKAPEKINLLSIMNSVEEDITTRTCLGEKNCRNGKICLSHSLWASLDKNVTQFFKDRSLADAITISQKIRINS